MTATLDAIRDKPVALYQMDDTAPFQDYSGYGRVGTTVAGTVTNSIALAAGAVYSSVFNRDVIGKFDSPVFKQGSESKPFSLESWVYPIRKTTGLTAQPYRENLVLNPSANINVTNWISISTDSGAITRLTSDTTFSTAARKTAASTGSVGMGVMTNVIQPGTYTASFWVKCSVATGFIVYLEGTATKVPYSKTGVSLTANTWTKQTITFDVTVAGSVKVGGYVNPTIALGATLDIAGVTMESGTNGGSYLDGSMPGYEWAGTANNSISRTRPDIAYVNPMTSSLPFALGAGSSVTQNITANGKTWSRVTISTGGAGSRTFANLSELVQGATYIASYLLYNDSASSVTVNLDWCDGGINATTVAPGETKRLYTTPFSRTYDSTYRFIDTSLQPANATILISEPTLYQSGGVNYPFFNGDYPGAAWAGAANGSASYMYISDGEQQILGNTGKYDGLIINGTKVSFVTKYLTTGECRATYDLQIPRRVHAVGVHTSDKNMLFIDGELVAETELTEAQKADQYVVTDAFLYSGASLSSMQTALNNVCIYSNSLSPDQIARHFAVGNRHVPANSIPSQYGGVRIPLSQNEADIFLKQSWTTEFDWSDAQLTNVVVEDGMLKPRLVAGTSVAGTWLDTFALDNSGATSIYGVNMSWDGEGVIVEGSLDGITWETAVRGKNLALIAPGYNPTGKQLHVRVSFSGGVVGDPAFIDTLTVTGFTTSAVPSIANRVITATGSIKNDHEPLELSDDWGVDLNGGTLTIGADTSPDAVNPKTIEIWWKRTTDSSITTNLGGTWYSNANSAGSTVVGDWMVRHYVYASGFAGDITIGGNVQVGQVVLYPTAKTAVEVKEIYDAYTGRPRVFAVDASVIQITEPATAAAIYDHDWSISSSG